MCVDNTTTVEPTFDIWSAQCVYPISGLYTRLQRILFYAVLLVVFLFRSKPWLVGLGVGWLATYVLSATVHGLVPVFSPENGLDADLPVIDFIITTSVFVIAICLFTNPTSLGRTGMLIYLLGPCLVLTHIKSSHWVTSGLWVNIVISPTCGTPSIGSPEFADACDAVGHLPTILRTKGDHLEPIDWEWSLAEPAELSEDIMNAAAVCDYMKTATAHGTLLVSPQSQIGYSHAVVIGANAAYYWGILQGNLTMALVSSIAYLHRKYPPPLVTRNWLMRRLTTPIPREPGESRVQYAIRMLLTALLHLQRAAVFLSAHVLFPIFEVSKIMFIHELEAKLESRAPTMMVWHGRRLQGPTQPCAAPSSIEASPDRPAKALVHLGRIIALLGYVLNVACSLVWPGFVACLVLVCEIQVLTIFPEQEALAAVGQWAPWVGLVVVIGQALHARSQAQSRSQEPDGEELQLIGEAVEELRPERSATDIVWPMSWIWQHLSWVVDFSKLAA